ncbi:hypothetical protein [Micromonospora robiginosa]|uniref:Uncharacterized protein n=1 Tax=Micromonospora robiginosa TaxID=2749844 RepID=A0A7L6B8I6_9ACTN|nr:hypothetical protein [Micromonospora ferruginea]QLQ38293.1 hypothetical protein H1D33_05305 [Micromonospora ferruginea]
MPASVSLADKRTPTPLTVLFWIGVGLAPLAALILLVADGNGTLRFGAVLAILAVVLIGLSIALRPESGGAGAEELREELEQLRRELRAEIVAAAQRGNQALDQARRAEETAGAVRHRLDAAAAGLAAAPVEERPGGRARVPAAGAYEAGRVRRDEDEAGGRYGTDQRAEPSRAGRHDVERTGSDTYAAEGRARPEPPGGGRDRPAGHDEEHPGFGGHDADPPRPGPRRAEFDGHGTEPARPGGRGPERGTAGVYGAARVPQPGARPESRPVGMVHHTETVHVTTRHTFVGGGDPSGSRYGGFAGRWSPEADRSHGTGPGEYRGAGRDDQPRAGADADGWPGSLRAGVDRPWPGAHDDDSRDGDVRPGAPSGGPGWAGDRTGRAGDAAGWSGDEAGWSGDGNGWTGEGSGPAGGEHPWASVGRSAAGGPGWTSRAGDGGWATDDDRGRPADEAPPAPAWPRAGQYGSATTPERYGREAAPERYGPAVAPERYDREAAPERYGHAEPVDRPGRATPAEPDGADWSELRAGNRWAAVRDDGEGREFRVGERRAAVHADGAGTEYRIEDRWAAVRGAPGGYGAPPRHDPDPSYGASGSSWPDPDHGDSGRSPESRPALPAGGVPVPDEWRPPTQRSGQPEWRQVEPEWRRPEPERRQPEVEWRQPEPEWRQPEPERRQPEPQWHRPEPGGYGPPPRDAADRWR